MKLILKILGYRRLLISVANRAKLLIITSAQSEVCDEVSLCEVIDLSRVELSTEQETLRQHGGFERRFARGHCLP